MEHGTKETLINCRAP